jgi:hypothetical protein
MKVENKINKYLKEESDDYYALDLLEFDKDTEDFDEEIYENIKLDIGSCCALCEYVSSNDLFQTNNIYCKNSKILKTVNDGLKENDQSPVKRIETNSWLICKYYKENNQVRSMGA